MPLLVVDAETASTSDLGEVGADVYARTARVLFWSIACPDWPRALVFEQHDFWALLRSIKQANQIAWPAGVPLTIVHWGDFDRLLIEAQGPPPAGWTVRWINLESVSLSYGAPAELAAAAAFWLGTEGKDPGKHLIHRFSMPQADGRWITSGDDPIRWERFRSYGAQDANLTLGIFKEAAELVEAGGHRWSEHEPAWEAVWRMNRRGVAVDRAAAERATERLRAAEEGLVSECLDRFGVKPSQRDRVVELLGLPNAQKPTLEAALEDPLALTPDQRRLAEIRLETAGAARHKLRPMLRMSRPGDPRVRGAFRYHGAWTRRLSSLGIQLQNFVKEKSDEAFFAALAVGETIEQIFEAVRKNIRGFLVPEPGNVFVAADLAQIELRVGAWLSNEIWVLDLLRAKQDVYKTTAAKLFGLPVEAIGKPSRERDLGKVSDLSLIFQAGGEKLAQTARKAPYFLELTDEEGERIKTIWREAHPAHVAAWAEMRDAFIALCDAGHGTFVPVLGGRCRMERYDTHIRLVRPSGFAQYFWKPRVLMGRWPDGGPKKELGYVGLGLNGRMGIQRTYGGNLFQNAVQGTAADLILEAILRAESRGFEPVMTIHDEIVCEQGDDGQSWVDVLCEVVSEAPAWADGLPIEAEGWQGRRFTK